MSLPLYLASRSPRRKSLLAEAGIRFQVYVPREEELPAPDTRKRKSARSIVKDISAAKAKAAERELRAKGITKAVILTADTLVFQNHKVLGKPKDIAHARKMLRALSGKWHEVYTGVTVTRLGNGKTVTRSFQTLSKVRFFRLRPEWIEWYIATGEPLDKAGAYGIQGPGAALIEQVRGSYTNVVGLPLGETLAALENAGAFKRREA